MSWGQPHSRGAGTTAQIEEAHEALDSLGLHKNGTLAERVIEIVRLTHVFEDIERRYNSL